jgi:hypothetical protein
MIGFSFSHRLTASLSIFATERLGSSAFDGFNL